MNRWIAVLLLAALGHAYADDDDDDHERAVPDHDGPPSLSAAQIEALGVRMARPQPAARRRPWNAYGRVLSPAALYADLAELERTAATERAAAVEHRRLDGLHRAQGNAALSAVQAAQLAHRHAGWSAREAEVAFASTWGPLARMDAAERRALVEALVAGQGCLLRADLPGRSSLGALPQAAWLDVDGVQVSARVLGALPGTASGLSGVAVLLHADPVPGGLASGVRLPVTLLAETQDGVLVPKAALIYDEQGAYVYRVMEAPNEQGHRQFEPATVSLLHPQGDSWLVGGLDDEVTVVVHGAGVLWSLQGLDAAALDDDDE